MGIIEPVVRPAASPPYLHDLVSPQQPQSVADRRL